MVQPCSGPAIKLTAAMDANVKLAAEWFGLGFGRRQLAA